MWRRARGCMSAPSRCARRERCSNRNLPVMTTWPTGRDIGYACRTIRLPGAPPPRRTEPEMRKLKIIEHISLDGVMQVSSEGDGFPYADWTAAYRTPAVRDAVLGAHGEKLDLVLGRHVRRVVELLAKGPEQSDGRPPERRDEIYRDPSPGEPGVGSRRRHRHRFRRGLRRIKSLDGADLVLSGSASSTSTSSNKGWPMRCCCSPIPSPWARGNGSSPRGLRHVAWSSSARKRCPRASFAPQGASGDGHTEC